jgi:hypothetical protein
MTSAPNSGPESPRPLTDEELQQLRRRRMPFGIAFLVGTNVVLGKWFVWDPLQAARAGADSVRYSLKGVFLTGVLPGAILLALYAWRTWPDMERRFREKPALRLMAAIALLVPGVLGLLWFQSQLAALGYRGK